jgi:UDP-glucuronate decarboxylase
MIRLMDSPDEVTGPINIGNPGEFTMIQLAELVLKLAHSKSKLVRMPIPADDPKQRKPDITRAQNTLGWEPKVQLEDGLEETIAYFRKLLNE